MNSDYWEAHEAEWLAEQDAMDWLLFEADLESGDPWAD